MGTNNWKAVAVVGYKDGKAVRKTKSGFKTKSEALAYIPELKRTAPRKEEPITLAKAFELWFPTCEIAPNTRLSYNCAFRMFEPVQYVPLASLTIDELQELFDNSKLSRGAQNVSRTVLGLIFRWAIPRGYVPSGVNMASYIKTRGTLSKGKPSITPAQLERLRQAVGVVPHADRFYCSCLLGFRPGEMVLLTCADYDPVERTIRGGIKTEAGKDRVVTISPKIQPIIDRLVEEAHGGYIFGQNGKKISYSTWREWYYKVRDACGLPPGSSPHICRHTFATLMKAVDAPDKDKLELIGHANESMLRYYQDVSLDDLRAITDAL